MHLTTRSLAIAGTAVAALVLTGCAAPSQDAADDGTISIVASTSVYGDIAEQIAGQLATVTSIITSAAQDPHSYEASAQDQLTMSKADLVIENGGGYDPFIDLLLNASGSTAIVINASDVFALIEGFHEHVWYSFDAVQQIAEEIAVQLGKIDPANAAAYTSSAEGFTTKIDALESRAEELDDRLEGGVAAVTEPVAVYLLEEVGLDNGTPSGFTEAIEEGADVPPAALQAVLDLIDSGTVTLLAYNEQTASAETERVRDAAFAAGIPVVSFAETLPEGSDYLSWMSANLDALAVALP